MGPHRKLALFLVAFAATAFSSEAATQCRLCDQPTPERAEEGPNSDVQLRIETALNFDRIVLSGAGAVTIRPDGSSSVAGSVDSGGPRAMVGTVLVHGEGGRAVRIELPKRIEIFSLSGGRITLTDVTSDLPSTPRLDAAGNLSFRFGGRLELSGDADGQYRGDLPITVEYL